jgi:Uncharacterized oxidoreductases, Fe-dependent alcohol dehydrogenase family
MNDFIFQNKTKVYFGKNLLSNLSKDVLAYGTRVLMVYGGGSLKRNGLYNKVTSILKDAGISIFELSGVEPNPRHTTVNHGAAICRKKHIDLILAVGGGSSIDCSKGMQPQLFQKQMMYGI